MTIDGVWTSGDVLIRLTECRDVGENERRSKEFGKLRTEKMAAMCDLINTKMSPGLEITNRLFEPVLPKRSFVIFIGRVGWTGERESVRQVVAEIIREIEKVVVDSFGGQRVYTVGRIIGGARGRSKVLRVEDGTAIVTPVR